MRETAFIICEYNPFHNGHLCHIRKTRDAGAKTVVALMSGNFVQRGEPAAFDKAVRAEIAVLCGADLVAELPLPAVLSDAKGFAEGAAKTAAALGGNGTLSFGCLAGEDSLFDLRRALSAHPLRERAAFLAESDHITWPRALQRALDGTGEARLSGFLEDPNTVLALEYLTAFGNAAPDVDFYPVRRSDSARHDALSPAGDLASGKYIRRLLFEESRGERVGRYVPPPCEKAIGRQIAAGRGPLLPDRFSVFAISRLLGMKAEQLRRVNGVSQGLENRILRELPHCSDLQTLYDRVKSKRYTHARIRRAIVCASLGITREMQTEPFPYVRILAMNDRGRSFLRERAGAFTLPVVMNLSQAPVSRARELDALAGRVAAMLRPAPFYGDTEYAVRPYVFGKEKA